MDVIDEAAANGLCFPYDVLLDILRRVPGRALAASSRLVCRSWRGMVDAHGLLLPHVFPPREFPGVFATYYGFPADYGFFARPRSRSSHAAPGEPSFPPRPFSYAGACVQQHCNGLLLLRDGYRLDKAPEAYVCNPATQRHERLPSPPPPWSRPDVEGMFLAFDPAVSRHHEVFFFPKESWPPEEEEESSQLSKEDAHKVLHMLVFSSRTGQWDRRQFSPGRHASKKMLFYLATTPCGAKDRRTWLSAEYWRGSIYIHCRDGVLLIVRCSEGSYDTIRLPKYRWDPSEAMHTWTLPKKAVLTNHDGGIRYAALAGLTSHLLHVWELTESSEGKLGWTLAHKADLSPYEHVLDDDSLVRPRVRWGVVECCKRDFLLHHKTMEMIGNNKMSGLISYGGVEKRDGAEDEVEEDESGAQDEVEEDESADESTQGSEYTWETDEDDIAGVEENIAPALGLEEDASDDVTSEGGSDHSWNSDEHNFIHVDESVIANLEEDEEEDDESEELDSEDDSEDTDDEGLVCSIVGIHPHKNVLLLHLCNVAVAYHLDTSKIQYLGYMFPEKATDKRRGMHGAFPYRPCYIDALPSSRCSTS